MSSFPIFFREDRRTASCVLATACALLVGAACGDDGMHLSNPGFEMDDDGWKIPKTLWSIEKNAGRDGSAALVYENTDPKAYTFPRRPIPVKPGEIYRYSAWTKVDKPGKGGKYPVPKVSIDYADTNGVWIGAEYARAVGKPDANGWVRYEGVTAPVPAIAATGNLFGFVAKGGSGRVRFDDFSIEKIGERPIDAFTSSAYRDEAKDGKVTFVATLFPNPGTRPIDSLAPVFVLKGADGQKYEIKPDEFDVEHTATTIDVASLAPGRQSAAFILRTRGGREIARASLVFTRGTTTRRVTFDRYGRTIVAGKPFFPLGMYARDVTPQALALYTTNGAPWNCIMPYHAPGRDMLDRCDQAGLKVIYCVKDIVFGAQFAKPPYDSSRKASLDRIAQLAGDVKGHPAILAYYTNDEAPPRQAVPLREVRSLLHGIDPDHPVWHVIDKAPKIRPMLGAFDVLGTDPYPVGLKERLPGHSDLGEVTRSIQAAQEAMYGAAPVWQVVQAFDWTWDGRWKYASQRFPTKEEISAMTWQAIANGANGVIYYAFHRICMGAKPPERDDYLRRAALAGAEVREKMPVLLSKPGPAILSAPVGAVCRSWRTSPKQVTVLAVNTTDGDVSGAITLAGEHSPLPVAIPPLGHVFLTVNTKP